MWGWIRTSPPYPCESYEAKKRALCAWGYNWATLSPEYLLHLNHNRRLVCQCVSVSGIHLGSKKIGLYMSDGFRLLGRPLWRVDRSVITRKIAVVPCRVCHSRVKVLLSHLRLGSSVRISRLSEPQWTYSNPPPHGGTKCLQIQNYLMIGGKSASVSLC